MNGEVIVNTGIVPDTDEGAYLGTAAKPFSDAHIGEIRIAQTDDNTIDTATGNLTINATTGSSVAIQTNTTISGNLDLTSSPSGSGRISANYLDVPNVTPIGGIIMWPGSITNFPANWFICNGQELSISTYSTLYSILTNSGTTFPFGANTNGVGSAGSTHFRLPNLLERFVVGAGGDNPSVSGSGYSVGDNGGANSVTLDVTQMPVHKHTTSIDGYAIEVSGGGSYSMGPGNRPQTAIGFNMSNAGGSGGVTQSHENRPPYFGLIHLIRVQ